ncbi:MAG: aconitate hydratase [Solirubrobacterales bacterium]
MGKTVSHKLIEDHLVSGEMTPGEEIGLKIDQTLTQDATGTMVMLEFEALGLDSVRTELSAQYVDHNILQVDYKNPDDHLFLRSACEKFGVWFSKPGNGVSHPVHQQRFGKPGKTLLGSDSHTPAAGALGMLSFGAGGLDVAMAMAGEPFHVKMPEIWGIKLTGELPDWTSAKDAILTMLARHGVSGGTGRIIEWYGPGLATLTCMDRHVMSNMGTELGATSTVFPSDDEVKRFLASEGREDDWTEILADDDASYDVTEELDLSEVVPMIARPSSPGDVVPVREVEGKEIYQVVVGSSANPGWRDFAVPAEILTDRQTHDRVSFEVNPTSRQSLEALARDGHLASLIEGGARVHQAGCLGCIGMGQAPASDEISLRTMPRNFPGRSGTDEDMVYLCSPETAVASALTGKITDPRDLADEGISYPKLSHPEETEINTAMLLEPDKEKMSDRDLRKGPNIADMPQFSKLPDTIEADVYYIAEDDISTDAIMPAGQKALPYRSNIPEIAKFAFAQVDEDFYDRGMEKRDNGGGVVIGGKNYGQGSSREHAAIVPRYLGVHAVVAEDYARIHWQNLVSYGVLPLLFDDPSDKEKFSQGDKVTIEDIHSQLDSGEDTVKVTVGDHEISTHHGMSERQIDVLKAGGAINHFRQREHGE